MSRPRRGIVLPVVLGVMVALALLSSMALFDALLEWRVSGLAADRVRARAAALEGLGAVATPPDLQSLCLQPPLARQEATRPAAPGGTYRVVWRHLGGGLVRAEVDGVGTAGARSRLIALVVPDSAERGPGLFRCPSGRRLVPAAAVWLEGDPAG
jgi:hypothetical protein